MLAKRRKRGAFSFGPQTSAATLTENTTKEDSNHKSSPTPVKRTPFSDDRSDEDDDSLKTERRMRAGRLVTSVSSVSEGAITLSSNEKPPASQPPTQASKPGTLATDSMGQLRQNSASKPSQIGLMLEKRHEAARMMTQLTALHSEASSVPPIHKKPLSGERSGKTPPQGFSDEDTLFRVQLEQCAEDARPDAYDAMPVSGFGEAMLRAMGWAGPSSELAVSSTDNLGDSGSSDLPKPRPDRLGLGAKLTSGVPLPPSRKRKCVALSNSHAHGNGRPPRAPPTPSRVTGTSRTDDSSNFGLSQSQYSDAQNAHYQSHNNGKGSHKERGGEDAEEAEPAANTG